MSCSPACTKLMRKAVALASNMRNFRPLCSCKSCTACAVNVSSRNRLSTTVCFAYSSACSRTTACRRSPYILKIVNALSSKTRSPRCLASSLRLLIIRGGARASICQDQWLICLNLSQSQWLREPGWQKIPTATTITKRASLQTMPRI